MKGSWILRWLWLAPLLLGLVWVQANGYRGLSEQDSHDYLRMARAWHSWLNGGELPGSSIHPQAYPIMGALLSALTRDVWWAMRLIPLLAFVAVGAGVRSLVTADRSRADVWWPFLVLCIGTSPFLLRHAYVVMSDLPAIALCVWCLVFVRRAGLWTLVALMAAACAVWVRFAAFPVVAAMLLVPLLEKWAGCRFWWGLVVLVLVACVVRELVPTGLWSGTPLEHWSPLNLFRRELRSVDGVHSYPLPNGLRVVFALVHPGFVPLAIALVPFLHKEDLWSPLVRHGASVVLVYLFFVGGMPFQNDRVLLLVQPFIALCYFPAFARAWSWAGTRWKGALFRGAFLVALLQMGLFVRAMHPFMRRAALERSIAQMVQAQEASVVYTHGMGGAITTYCRNVRAVELWYAPIDTFRSRAVVVVRPQDLGERWAGLPPAINWQRLQAQGLEKVAGLPDGWELFRLR